MRLLCLLIGGIAAFLGLACLFLFIWEGLFGKGPDGVFFVGAVKLLLVATAMLAYWHFSRPRSYRY